MHPLQRIPKFLRRHCLVTTLCRLGIMRNLVKGVYNENSHAFFDLLDPEPRNIFLKKSFEPDFFYLSKAFLRKNGIFFDLGANHGFCTFGLVHARPNAKFHLFEANAEIAKIISKSITLNMPISAELKCACIAEEEGKSSFVVVPNQTGQSHVASIDEKGNSVPNIVLDQYCKANEVGMVDFVKIDIEGHELPALKGWTEFLSEHRAKAIYIEIMPENQARYGLPTNAPLDFLEGLGYKLFLCKKDDFGSFGNAPSLDYGIESKVPLSFFKAENYPEDFATDVLALPPN